MSNNNSDGIDILIGLGLIAVVGSGIYVVLKAIAEYEENERLSRQQALQLASSYSSSSSSSYERKPNCEIHGMDADLCDNCHGCMECLGRDDDQFCVNCWYDDED